MFAFWCESGVRVRQIWYIQTITHEHNTPTFTLHNYTLICTRVHTCVCVREHVCVRAHTFEEFDSLGADVCGFACAPIRNCKQDLLRAPPAVNLEIKSRARCTNPGDYQARKICTKHERFVPSTKDLYQARKICEAPETCELLHSCLSDG
jgi:hypothetical protein